MPSSCTSDLRSVHLPLRQANVIDDDADKVYDAQRWDHPGRAQVVRLEIPVVLERGDEAEANSKDEVHAEADILRYAALRSWQGQKSEDRGDYEGESPLSLSAGRKSKKEQG